MTAQEGSTHAGSRPAHSRQARRDVELRERFVRYHERKDAAVREELVCEFLPLARKLARRYVRSSEPNDDLFQVASLGLVKAIDGFDPSRGPTFASFAIPTILGELRRYFRDSTWALHVPRGAQERARAIEDSIGRFTGVLGTAPTVDEIAADLGIGVEEVLDGLLARRAYETESFDSPVGHQDGLTVAEAVGAEDERYDLVEEQATVLPALRLLSARERRVLQLRYVGEMSQKDIAERIGVSQMQVSRILAGTIARIRDLSGVAEAA
jgi:RNA polymerase sigma-B factor